MSVWSGYNLKFMKEEKIEEPATSVSASAGPAELLRLSKRVPQPPSQSLPMFVHNRTQRCNSVIVLSPSAAKHLDEPSR
jgi:hypothetical protein